MHLQSLLRKVTGVEDEDRLVKLRVCYSMEEMMKHSVAVSHGWGVSSSEKSLLQQYAG